MERKHLTVTAAGLRSGSLTVKDALAPVYGIVDLTAGYMSYIADASLLTAEQLLAFAVTFYADEVSEGGHEKFLYDPAGMLWRETVIGLDEIGAHDAAEELRSLRDRFVPEVPFEQAERIRLSEEQELWFDEEDAFFRSHEQEIRRLLEEYVRNNAEAFEFDGDI